MCIISQLIIIVLFVALIIIIKKLLVKEEKAYDKNTMNISDFKTGDIVSVAYNGPIVPSVIKLVTGSIWNHNGIVYVDPSNGIPYVMEGAVYKGGYDNFFMIPLVTWVRINKGHKISIRHINKPPSSEDLLTSFNRFRYDSKLGGINTNITRYFRKIPYDTNFNYHKSYTCYEGTFRTLQDAGIYKKLYEACYFRPSCMMNRDDLTDIGYSYGKAHELELGSMYNRSYIP